MAATSPPPTRRPIALLLDHVRSAYNVGAAFRLADAFLLEKIYTCGITPHPPHPQIHKTALGAQEVVPSQHAPDLKPLLDDLKATGHTLIAVEQTPTALPLQDLPDPLPAMPCVLIFGHEVFGVSETALQAADLHLMIPQYGTKKSMNVSTCIGIVAWELLKKWEATQQPLT